MDQAVERLNALTEDWETKHYPPVHPKYFFRLTATFLIAAFIIFCAFIVYMINTPKEKRQLSAELSLALVGSIFSGFGTVFLFNLTGNYL